MIKILKQKKGFSLIELAIAMLILAIAAASATQAVAHMLRAYSRANDLAEINLIFDSLSSEILGGMTGAEGIEVSEINGAPAVTVTAGAGQICYYTDGVGGDGAGEPEGIASGYLCKTAGAVPAGSADRVYSPEYYKGKTISLQFFDASGGGGDYENFPLTGASPAHLSGIVMRINIHLGGSVLHRDYAASPLLMQ